MNEVSYLRGAEEHIIASEILQISQAVKRDIGRYLRYHERAGENTQVDSLAEKCKDRILERLSQIAMMQTVYAKNDTEWKGVLKLALSRVYKHKHTDEFEKKLSQLFDEYELDTSISKVHFVQAYMEIVAQIPVDQVNIPFHR